MRKYGIEHFHISLIEETDNPEEREKYWIEYLGTFKNGYNATIGGDGAKYIDYDLVVITYNNLKSITKTAQTLNICADSVSTILNIKKVNKLSSQEVSKLYKSNPIIQYDLNNNFIKVFPSVSEAVRQIVPNTKSRGAISHITDVCKGKRKSAYGFKWQFAK